MSDIASARERIKHALETRAFVRASETRSIAHSESRMARPGEWIFNIKAVSLDTSFLDDVSHVFWDTYKDRGPLQIGGQETAAIPLLTALVVAGAREGHEVSGFYLRKSRKKEGLMNMVEGELHNNRPVVLVDDLVNQGHTLRRQVDALESLGQKVTDIWTLVRFRDLDAYAYFTEKGITVLSLFDLNDFADTLQVKNLTVHTAPIAHDPYKVVWKFSSGNPSHQLVVPKSDPAIDETRLYVGSDRGTFWALNQENGEVAWKYQIGFHPKGKGIFSSPAVHEGVVYFGGYDGNVYALDAATGKKKWMSMEADWIGSSPALSPELGLLFIGLEFGLWRKRGGIAAIDLESGKTKWRYSEMPCLTHSTPRYIPEYCQVAIGSNDGCVYLFDATSGALAWKVSTGELTPHELNAGFSAHDIKEAVTYDAERDLIIAANLSDSIFFIDRLTGEVRATFKAEFGFFSTPLVYEGCVYASSLDKNLYCIDLDTFTEKWRWHADARIFASPALIEENIYIGANTGRLTELDPATGKERSVLHLTERITNRPVYNPSTKRLFVPTFANEIYCVERKDS